MTDITTYFKNTKITSTQKLKDFCGGGIGYDLYSIIQHWLDEPNQAIKHLKNKRNNNILSVEKLADIFNTSKYQIYKTKRFLTEIGLLKTKYNGIPCHCNYEINEEIVQELYDLEPDYKAKQRKTEEEYNKSMNIPSEYDFIDFYIISGGLEKEAFILYNQLKNKNFKDKNNKQIINWRTYIKGVIKIKNNQDREKKQRETIEAFKNIGVDGLNNIEFNQNKNNNEYFYNKNINKVPTTNFGNW